MTTQNLGGAAKAVLRGKFIAIQSYLKKQYSLMLYLNNWKRENKKTPKFVGGKKS